MLRRELLTVLLGGASAAATNPSLLEQQNELKFKAALLPSLARLPYAKELREHGMLLYGGPFWCNVRNSYVIYAGVCLGARNILVMSDTIIDPEFLATRISLTPEETESRTKASFDFLCWLMISSLNDNDTYVTGLLRRRHTAAYSILPEEDPAERLGWYKENLRWVLG